MPKKEAMMSHNPCFNRITFAIHILLIPNNKKKSHNPCFNRITFAIGEYGGCIELLNKSQSLF